MGKDICLLIAYRCQAMIINKAFFISGFKSLVHLAPNMDALVALGSSASFGWSLYVLYEMTVLVTNGTANADLMALYHEDRRHHQ